MEFRKLAYTFINLSGNTIINLQVLHKTPYFTSSRKLISICLSVQTNMTQGQFNLGLHTCMWVVSKIAHSWVFDIWLVCQHWCLSESIPGIWTFVNLCLVIWRHRLCKADFFLYDYYLKFLLDSWMMWCHLLTFLFGWWLVYITGQKLNDMKSGWFGELSCYEWHIVKGKCYGTSKQSFVTV